MLSLNDGVTCTGNSDVGTQATPPQYNSYQDHEKYLIND